MSDSFAHELERESWSLFGVAISVILLRTYARWRRVRSLALLAPDDWIIITAVPAFYITLVVSLNATIQGGGSNLYEPGQFETFSAEEIEERIKGSKIVIVSEQAMLNVTWSLKICMLFMYARLVVGTKYIKWVKYLGVYVAIGYVAVQITFFTICRPFKGYWGVPPPDPQCATLTHYSITQATFNISSDLCMLAIPLPMLFSLKLPLKQKVVLGIVFSMGVFVIIAAILSKVYNLSNIYTTIYMLWYVREASVAVFVTNLPGIWPLLREQIRFLRSQNSYPTNSGVPTYGNISTSRNVQRSGVGKVSAVKDDEVELSRQSFSKSTTQSQSVYDEEESERTGHFERNHELSVMRKSSPESDERRLRDEEGWGNMSLEVHVNKTIEVQRESRDSAARQVRQNRFQWEVEEQAPKVMIEGPDGEVLNK